MLELGFVSAILANQSFEEVIDFASANDFGCVEIMCWPKGMANRRYAGVTHVDVDELDDDKAAYIKGYLKARKVAISGLGYYPNPLDADPDKSGFYLEHIKKVIHAAARLGVGVVNTFVGRDQHKSVAHNIGRFREVWPELVSLAEKKKVKIGIENCPMLFTDDEWPGGQNLATTPHIWDQLFHIIPSPYFGLNYDPSHLVWQQMDEVQPIYDYHERLHHIHLKDAKLYRDKLNKVGIMAHPLAYHSPRLPGLGDVRWKKFFDALHAVKYKGPVCIEVEDKDFENSGRDIARAILQSRDYVRRFME
jgi:sugar phosphate isomerase/epimerase